MTLVDEAIASGNLLQLLEYLDRILEIYGGTRKNERIATIAIHNSLFPLSAICDMPHTKALSSEMVVMRNLTIKADAYGKIFKGHPLGPAKTELDLFFLNVPTPFGHPSEGKINFYVEIEMSGNVMPEEEHLVRLHHYFADKGLMIYPVLVCSHYKEWDTAFKIPILDIEDLKKIVELATVRSLDDIPGAAYEWAATCLHILVHAASKGEVDISKELWDAFPGVRQLNFNRFIEKGEISTNSYEDFNFDFRPRIGRIVGKMCEKELLKRNDRGKYELSADGRDILACYLSIKEEEE